MILIEQSHVVGLVVFTAFISYMYGRYGVIEKPNKKRRKK
jgi:hypothetical protein